MTSSRRPFILNNSKLKKEMNAATILYYNNNNNSDILYDGKDHVEYPSIKIFLSYQIISIQVHTYHENMRSHEMRSYWMLSSR